MSVLQPGFYPAVSFRLNCHLVLLTSLRKPRLMADSCTRLPQSLSPLIMAYMSLLCNCCPSITCFRGVLAKDGAETLSPQPAVLCFYEAGISERFRHKELIAERTFNSFQEIFLMISCSSRWFLSHMLVVFLSSFLGI